VRGMIQKTFATSISAGTEIAGDSRSGSRRFYGDRIFRAEEKTRSFCMFDVENLLFILKSKGFRNVRLRPLDPSLDIKERDLESIYAEAEK